MFRLLLERSRAQSCRTRPPRRESSRGETCGFGAVSAHVCVVEIGALQRETSLCPVQLECSRFLASAVQMVGSSSFAWLSFPEPLAESGYCPLSVGSMVARSVAIWLSNVPDPMTWVPSVFTRVRSAASEV